MEISEKIRQLEQTGILRMLLIMYNRQDEELRPSQIQKALIGSNDAYYKSRNNLIDLELIEKIDDKYKTVSYFRLTSKGKKIAELVNKINLFLF